MDRINEDKGCIEQETRFSSIENRGEDNQYKEAKEARKARKARKDTEKIRGPLKKQS